MSKLTKEDILFLSNLKQELLQQDLEQTDQQANPKYWGIMETKYEQPCWEEDADYFIILVKEYYGDTQTFTDPNDFKNYIDTYFIQDLDTFDWEDDEKEDILDEWSSLTANTDDLINFYENYCDGEVSLLPVKDIEVLSKDTGCFLTKKAAQKYINNFGYNHSNPRTYAMTAYRNFELERLLNIIKSIDWQSIEMVESKENK